MFSDLPCAHFPVHFLLFSILYPRYFLLLAHHVFFFGAGTKRGPESDVLQIPPTALLASPHCRSALQLPRLSRGLLYLERASVWRWSARRPTCRVLADLGTCRLASPGFPKIILHVCIAVSFETATLIYETATLCFHSISSITTTTTCPGSRC